MESLPLWERGLKSVKQHHASNLWVAPLVGAWIEMAEESKWKGTIIVAPLVGAWIEMMSCL